MGHQLRQFGALTKKNLISHARMPGSSICQLICPAILMLALVWIRSAIETEESPYINLEKFRRPFFPALEYIGGGKFDSNDISTPASRQASFLKFDDYSGDAYDMESDKLSPLNFLPEMCLRENGVSRPRVPSQVIAVVGEQNPVQTMLTNYLQTLFEVSRSRNESFPEFSFKEFDTEEDLNTYISDTKYFNISAGLEGICFGYQITQKAANDYDAHLYFNDQEEMSGPIRVGIPTQLKPAWDPSQSTPQILAYRSYTEKGYSLLHNLIANFILKRATKNDDATISLMTVPIEADVSPLDLFSLVVSLVLPRFLLFMYILPVFKVVSLMVQEKESKARESMRIMGMTDTPYWMSWFVYYTLINTIMSLIAWLVLCINVIGPSDKFFVFLFIWLYGQAVFGEIIFMQSLFKRSKFSGMIAAVVYFILVLANTPLEADTVGKPARFVGSMLPQVASQQICVVYAAFESSGVGINSSTIGEFYKNYSFAEGLICLAISVPLWAGLGIYLDKVLPREFGTSEKWYFPFQPSFWGCCRSSQKKQEGNGGSEGANIDSEYYEPVASDIAKLEQTGKFVNITDLRKTYENKFQAVKGLNIKMYQGQIFALLGQNGAGKTTTISMLTGLITPTEGDAQVYDKDIFGDMTTVRRMMGVCPQHDVLFELLTPEEHLDLFYELKNGDPDLKKKEIDEVIRDVGLTADAKKQAGIVSGGTKRKLSVSIALVGQSKFVLLDEPTSGMDLVTRRMIWTMLRKYRQDRIIILTTHYMDEADVLGDRIGVMAHGELKCLGSSLFLKNKFGGGYKMVMVKKSKSANKLIHPYLNGYFGEVEKLSEIASEITFMIPKEKRSMFQQFFKEFDQKLDDLEIKSYGISITTLEEVFLAINAEDAKQTNNALVALQNNGEDGEGVAMDENDEIQGAKPAEDNSVQNLTNDSGIMANNYALLVKRAHIYKRDRVGLCCELACPFLLVLIGCALAKVEWSKDTQFRPLTPQQYPLPQRIGMNEFAIVSDTKTEDLFNNLPNARTSFELNTIEADDYLGFQSSVIDLKNQGEPSPYRFGSYQIFRADADKDNYQVNAHLNLTSQDVAAFYPQFIYESILKTATGDDEFKFSLTTTPFPVYHLFRERAESTNAILLAFMVGIAISLIPTLIVSFILKEREDHLKHMQLISGMSKFGYWLSNAIADIIKAYITMAIILLITVLFGVNQEGFWLLCMLYPPAIVMFSYMITFFFTKESNAQIMVFSLSFLISGVLAIMVFALQTIEQTANFGNQLRWWFCLIPGYCVTHGIILATSLELLMIQQPGYNGDLWAWTNLKGDAACLVGHFVFGLIVLIIAEADLFTCLSNFTVWKLPKAQDQSEADEDVQAEENRVLNQGEYEPAKAEDLEHSRNDTTDVIRVAGFTKAYTTMLGKPVQAVEKITFGLDYGECFALLGVNGAGKTTTFKSLTGDVVPTKGELSISGLDILKDFKQVRKLIGYCPQDLVIFPLMTVEEHLWFFARIKGIPADRIADIVGKSVIEMNLVEHRLKPAGTLSGGNKRKLQVAIATLGNPPIILLDEPSAGMDPQARRFMWSVVERISQRDKKSAVILTTHSMEEAEALSTKMGIMVRGGTFKCFGSSQHIKNRFGTGFEIQLKIRKTTKEDLKEVVDKCEFNSELDQPIDLVRAVEKCDQIGMNSSMLKEIREGGLGSDLFFESEANNGQVILDNLASYLFVQQNGVTIIDKLARIFKNVELVEQCADFYKLKVPRDDKTIGYLFGLIEDMKTEANISEYSVTQTSLEQIFQNFANQEVEEKVSLTFAIEDDKLVMLNNPKLNVSQTVKAKSSSATKVHAGDDILSVN